jgi:hypothetical protein
VFLARFSNNNCFRGADNHSPTRQMQVEIRIGELKYKPTRQSGECFFPLSLSLSAFLASCFLTWRVKILNYSPVWRVSWKTYPHPWMFICEQHGLCVLCLWLCRTLCILRKTKTTWRRKPSRSQNRKRRLLSQEKTAAPELSQPLCMFGLLLVCTLTPSHCACNSEAWGLCMVMCERSCNCMIAKY